MSGFIQKPKKNKLKMNKLENKNIIDNFFQLTSEGSILSVNMGFSTNNHNL